MSATGGPYERTTETGIYGGVQTRGGLFDCQQRANNQTGLLKP
jgi:hypothetical protein